jgi:homoserine dehydrogenase
MGDVLEVARHMQMGIPPITGSTVTEDLPILEMDGLKTKYYVRFRVADRPGVLAAASTAFAKAGVSVQSVNQRGSKTREDVDLVFVTHTAKESAVRQAIDEILALEDCVTGGYPSIVRVED